MKLRYSIYIVIGIVILYWLKVPIAWHLVDSCINTYNRLAEYVLNMQYTDPWAYYGVCVVLTILVVTMPYAEL
jgi:hypothetical protein